jgi:hypothetical protein
MTLQDIEKLVQQLEPRDQLKLAAGICENLSARPTVQTDAAQSRRQRMLESLAFCDEVAESITGDFDSTEDLRKIRDQRMVDLDRAVRGC